LIQGFAGACDSRQRQLGMPQVQDVAQVQTGLQLQLQFWQPQEALDETRELVGFVFMCDWVSYLLTESFAESYTPFQESHASFGPMSDYSWVAGARDRPR
jgi:hypothetical protein